MFSNSKKEWQKHVLEPTNKRFPEREKRFQTSSGSEVEALYTPEDFDASQYDESLGYPGEFPFTRGVQPNMYRGRLWSMRQYAGFASAEESNKRYRFLLEQGQTGLSIAFDLPTQIGYDSEQKCSSIVPAREADGTRVTPSCTVFHYARTLTLRQSHWPHSEPTITSRSYATP